MSFEQHQPLEEGVVAHQQGFGPYDLHVPDEEEEDPSSALFTTEQLPSPTSMQAPDSGAYDDVEQLVNVAMDEHTNPDTTQTPLGISTTDGAAVAQNHHGETIPATTTPPNLFLQCPHPYDVLMPIDGYRLWPGNCRYMHAVNQRKEAFAQADGDRSTQTQIELEVVHHIQQQQRPAGRFLTAIEVPVTANPNFNNVPVNESIVSTTMWQIMPPNEVLEQLEKHLAKSKNEKKRRKKHKHKRKKKKRKQQKEEESEEETIPISSLGALQSLYYIPPHHKMQGDQSVSPEESSSMSESSSKEEEEEEHPPPPKPKKPRAPPKQPKAAPNKAAANKPVPTNSNSSRRPVNFHYKPKPMKSQQAAYQNEGKLTLPKGVTIRPSGKWQAQTYFAGQSRYIGVYETSRLAARAYVVVQDYLREYRAGNAIVKDTPKEEVAKIFAGARKAGDDAVKELQNQAEDKDTSPKQQSGQSNSFAEI